MLVFVCGMIGIDAVQSLENRQNTECPEKAFRPAGNGFAGRTRNRRPQLGALFRGCSQTDRGHPDSSGLPHFVLQ